MLAIHYLPRLGGGDCELDNQRSDWAEDFRERRFDEVTRLCEALPECWDTATGGRGSDGLLNDWLIDHESVPGAGQWSLIDWCRRALSPPPCLTPSM